MRAAIQIACRSARTMTEPLKRGPNIPRATGYIHIDFGRLGCCVYGDIHEIRVDIGGHGDGIFRVVCCFFVTKSSVVPQLGV